MGDPDRLCPFSLNVPTLDSSSHIFHDGWPIAAGYEDAASLIQGLI
jgi:hypothetical protein